MKILMLCEFYDPELQFQENLLVKYLCKQGHEVRVLTSLFTSVFDYYSGKIYPKGRSVTIRDHCAEIVRLPYRFNLLNKIRPFQNVKYHLNDFEPDLVYLHDIIPNTGEIAGYMLANPGCRAIMDIHMDYSNSGKNWASLKILHGVIRRYYLDRIRSRLSAIYPVVPASVQFMKDIYAVPEREMELLPLGGDVELVTEIERDFDRKAFRHSLGCDSQDFVMVTGGKLASRKRIEIILDMMSRVELAQSRLVVIGEFPDDEPGYRDTILAQAKSLGSRVNFVGWQDARGSYEHMLAADLAIFPASQSVMWQQSIVSGLPLIVGDTGGQSAEYLNLHGNVVVVPSTRLTGENFTEEALKIYRSKDLLEKMGEGARRTAREFLSWDSIAKKIVSHVDPPV